MQTNDGNDKKLSGVEELHTLSIDSAIRVAAQRITKRNHCSCLNMKTKKGMLQVHAMHTESQDEDQQGWRQVIELINETEEKVFEPSAHISWAEWARVITLPPQVALLDHVTIVRLYGSSLRRLPPEIGRMPALKDLDIYTSYALHWLPYEIIRCINLRNSRMSTQALYGNRNTRLPFPRLYGVVETLLPTTCSVCDRTFGDTPQLWWTTQRIGTDTVPLLVHSCSQECTDSIRSRSTPSAARRHKTSMALP